MLFRSAEQEISVDGRNKIDVFLGEEAAQLDEVVITAFGIKKEKI